MAMKPNEILSFVAEDIELAKRTLSAAADRSLDPAQYRMGVRQLERALDRLRLFADVTIPVITNKAKTAASMAA